MPYLGAEVARMWRAVLTALGSERAYRADGETVEEAVGRAMLEMADGDAERADPEDVRVTEVDDERWFELRRLADAPVRVGVLQVVDTGDRIPYGLGFCFRLP